jgi:hypothetical protein
MPLIRNSQQFSIGTRLKFQSNAIMDQEAYGTVIGRADNYELIVLLDVPLQDGSTAEVIHTTAVTVV